MWKMILFEMVGMLVVLHIAGTISGFLYIPVLVILLSVFVVIGGKHGLKGVGMSILVFIVSLVLFITYDYFISGPNLIDLKVMKPMTQKISNYIIKNGIPKSLKDIPDLPYGLEGCKKDIRYKKYTGNEDIDVYNQKEATYIIEENDCTYSNYGRVYKVSSHLNKNLTDLKSYLTLKIYRDASKTGVEFNLEYDTRKKIWKKPR